jgi:hypothetical protein
MGSADPGAVLAWDDDRGGVANARIVRKLQPGGYWLSVRHKGRQRDWCLFYGRNYPGLMIFSNPELDGLVRTLS